MKKYFVYRALICIVMLLSGRAVLAVDYTFSGYGTVGYAQSDQAYHYQRYINKSGTFMRDTVFGAQLDARLNPEWTATVQAKLASAQGSDNGWDAVVSWAFLSYRPANDLLIRAGKLRVPFYLNAENMDVGATYAVARLPNELYSVFPNMDFTGASFVKSWDFGDNELDLDGYWGQSNAPWRSYSRDTATPSWLSLKARAKGLLLSWHRQDDIFRVGVHSAELTRNDGLPFYINFTQVTTPGINGSYYTAPGPSGQTASVTSPTWNLGADVGWGHGFRTLGEYVRRTIKGTEIGPDTESFYITLLKDAGDWTPYVTYAQIKSKNLAIYQAVNGARVASQGAPQSVIDVINAAQRYGADALTMYDQYSWAVGTSWAVNKSSKIKAEWMAVHTGVTSSFIDAPAGGGSGNQLINVFSLSYSFLF
jgi:hypothetical protein